MSDVNDKFYLFLSVTPVMDFADGAGSSSGEMDLVFEAVSFLDVFSVDQTSLVKSIVHAPL